MIQRIQSFYLLLVILFSGILPTWLSLFTLADETVFYVTDSFNQSNLSFTIIGVLFYLSAIIAAITIFQFKNRKLQFVLGRLIILINLILLGFIVYYSQNLSGETLVSEKGIGLLIPIFTILWVVLANKAIQKDEELVKSVDRIR